MKYILTIIIIILIIAGAVWWKKQGAVNPESPENPSVASDLIHITYPMPGDEITSPLTVTGEARGNWYFEASFPLEVVDSAGNIVGQKYAEAQSDWMTTEFVPFKGTIEFAAPTSTAREGKVIFRKDNPSGLPEHDMHVEIPVRFK